MGDLQVPMSEQQSQMPVVQVPDETCWVVITVVCAAMTAKKKWWKEGGWLDRGRHGERKGGE